MLRERAEKYYLEGDYNCAEAILRAANDACALGLREDALRLAGGFGGGMGRGEACGALCGAMAVISAVLIETRAHATPGVKQKCADYVARFEGRLGGIDCRDLKPKYARDGRRCADAVALGAELLEEFLRECHVVVQR